MTLQEALIKASHLQDLHPDWLLCGSTALILAGVIPPREISDLDFATNIKGPELEKGTAYVWEQEECDHCKTPDADVFVHKNTVREGPRIWGIKLQHLGDIIKWKKSYNRSKDKKDLEVVPLTLTNVGSRNELRRPPQAHTQDRS